jgi:hypothetical protein
VLRRRLRRLITINPLKLHFSQAPAGAFFYIKKAANAM